MEEMFKEMCRVSASKFARYCSESRKFLISPKRPNFCIEASRRASILGHQFLVIIELGHLKELIKPPKRSVTKNFFFNDNSFNLPRIYESLLQA
jgi:hypothetical protein